jgi:anti-sigma factor RsiW
MTEPMDKAEETALWRHWRRAMLNAAGEAAPAPDPLLLAAYAEHRLGETEAEEVEAWLALHPEALADVLAARDSEVRPPSGQAPEAVLLRAMGLVPGLAATVVPFRRTVRPAPVWRVAVARVAVAASLLVVSLIGFTLGTDAYTSLLNGGQSAALSQDLFDPPTGIFSSLGEETSS